MSVPVSIDAVVSFLPKTDAAFGEAHCPTAARNDDPQRHTDVTQGVTLKDGSCRVEVPRTVSLTRYGASRRGVVVFWALLSFVFASA